MANFAPLVLCGTALAANGREVEFSARTHRVQQTQNLPRVKKFYATRTEILLYYVFPYFGLYVYEDRGLLGLYLRYQTPRGFSHTLPDLQRQSPRSTLSNRTCAPHRRPQLSVNWSVDADIVC